MPNAAADDARLYEPRASIGLTADWLPKVRAEVGPAPVLGVEYHHRLSVAEAASFCQRMPSGTLDFLEEPIRDESPEAYATLRSMTDVPFAIGEEFASKWQFLPYIERGLTNFVRVDICNVGGFTEAMKVAGWAEAHYIDLMPHNPLGPICAAATVHLAAAVPNFAWMEVRVSPTEAQEYPSADIFPQQLKLEGSYFPVPDAPGLGVDVNEEYIAGAVLQILGSPAPAPAGWFVYKLVSASAYHRDAPTRRFHSGGGHKARPYVCAAPAIVPAARAPAAGIRRSQPWPRPAPIRRPRTLLRP